MDLAEIVPSAGRAAAGSELRQQEGRRPAAEKQRRNGKIDSGREEGQHIPEETARELGPASVPAPTDLISDQKHGQVDEVGLVVHLAHLQGHDVQRLLHHVADGHEHVQRHDQQHFLQERLAPEAEPTLSACARTTTDWASTSAQASSSKASLGRCRCPSA